MTERLPTSARIIVLRYEEDLAPDKSLLRSLGVRGEDYWYLTATTALERDRQDLAPSHQWVEARRPDASGQRRRESILVIHKLLRHLLPPRLLTRSEERVLLQRAVQDVEHTAGLSPGVARAVRQDLFPWRDALADAAARGFDCAHPLPPALQAQLDPDVEEILRKLQRAYRSLEAECDRWSFEEAGMTFLGGRDFQPRSHVVLDSFTYFTPLQLRFIQACADRGAMVCLLHPYRAAQARGFRVMHRTYAEYVGGRPAVLPSAPLGAPGDLGILQRSLFADGGSETPGEDQTVRLTEYPHRHHEVADCIARLKTYLEAAGSAELRERARRVAIVTRVPRELNRLLQEEAVRQQLPAALTVPPRQLLLTPLGQFVLALYAIWQDGELQFSPEHFQTILASGWLGGIVQETSERFGAVRAQWFEGCSTQSEWQARLDALSAQVRALPESSRSAAALLDEETVEHWRKTIHEVRRLCRLLFSVGQQSIGGHVRLLLAELHRMVPEAEMRPAELLVLDRIRAALEEVAESASLPMSAAEFGDVLNSLVREYQRPTEEGDGPPAEDAAEPSIWVTTPEGIDSYQQDSIYYLGVDNRRVPRPYTEPWPFHEDQVAEQGDRERYLFLAVIRAARRELHLSFARRDEEGTYVASPYMGAVADLLQRPIIGAAVDLALAPTAPATPALAPGRARRREYQLAEVAHYALCPFRYKLERLSADARRYRDPFQVPFLAQANWLDLVLTRMRGVPPVRALQARGVLLQAMEGVRTEIESTFPGLRRHQWRTVRHYVQRDLEDVVRTAGDYPLQFLPGQAAELVLPDDTRPVRITVPVRHTLRKGRIDYPFYRDLLREEWLLPALPGQTADDERFRIVEGMRVFATLYHAVRWWGDATRAADAYPRARGVEAEWAQRVRSAYVEVQADARGWVGEIEAGRFPKNPGDHCKLCPVRADCLGLTT
jgi:hypothetical protein